MPALLISDATTEGLRPLGTPGQRSYDLVTGTVGAAAGLGPRHVHLFAEAVESAHGDRFDWYAPVEGPVRRLSDLSEQEAAGVRADLEGLRADIRAEAARLSATGEAQGARIGAALEHAVQYPSEQAVHVVTLPDGSLQPVIANWGWVEDRLQEAQSALSVTDRVQPPPPPVAGTAGAAGAAAAMVSDDAPAEATRTRQGRGAVPWWLLIWLGWLLLLAMVLAILYLLIEACALAIPGLPGTCPDRTEDRAAIFAETDALRAGIAALDRDLHALDRACQPVHDPAIPDPVAELPPGLIPPEPMDADAARLREQGATLGELTFSLLWSSTADLDLSVTCPAGAPVIGFINKSACGGVLDIDSNVAGSGLKADPVENVYFASPSGGVYGVRVNYYNGNSQPGPTPFRLRIQDGARVEILEGMVGPGQADWITRYSYGGP